MLIPTVCPVCKAKNLQSTTEIVYCTNCRVYNKELALWQLPIAWARTHLWFWRLPILAWFGWLLYLNLNNFSFALHRLANPFSALDMGIHELGHVLFSPLGQFMHIAGGSIFQLLFPILWMIGSLQKKWYFAATMCWCWLGISLFDVATYAADADVRLLPLAAGPAGIAAGSDSYDQGHDWYQMLSQTGHLGSAITIADWMRRVASVLFVIELGYGAFLMTQMMYGQFLRNRRETPPTDTE